MLLYYFIALAFCAACARGRAGDTESFSLSDSAGVSIITHTGLAALPAGNSWTSVALFGGNESNLRYQFQNIRGAIILSDGSVAIADDISRAIRFYDSTGYYLAHTGREGSGPGEFSKPPMLYRYSADSILTRDGARSLVLSVFDPARRFVRTFTLPQPVSDDPGRRRSYALRGVFEDGSLLVLDAVRGSLPEASGKLQEFRGRFLRIDHGGKVLADFGEVIHERNAAAALPGTIFIIRSAPFPQGLAAAAGRYFAFADASQLNVKIHDWEGRLIRIVRSADLRALPLDADRWSRMSEITIRMDGDEQPTDAQTRSAESALPLPDSLPKIAGLQLDESGGLAVAVNAAFGDVGVRIRWLYFDAAGAVTVLPGSEDERIASISPRHALTLFRDSLGVEYVRLWTGR